MLVQLLCDVTDLDKLANLAVEQEVLYFELENLFLRRGVYILSMSFCKSLGIVLDGLRLTFLLPELDIMLIVILHDF